LIVAWSIEWRPARLPTKQRRALGRQRQQLGGHQRVVEHQVGGGEAGRARGG
jgi:hypothetical protein